ncbi:MAG: YigZ family protein [Acidobacteriota bacterium]
MIFDRYSTLAGRGEARLKIQRSQFIGIAFPTRSPEDFFEAIEALTGTWFDASHLCWAYRILQGTEARSRSSDAGEPSGSAGKPILSAIESADLHETAVVVVRYYGGVKLGTGGLSRAYRSAAQDALRTALKVNRYLYQRIDVDVPFEAMNLVYRLISSPDILLVREEFGESNRFSIDVRLSMVEALLARLRAANLRFTVV